MRRALTLLAICGFAAACAPYPMDPVQAAKLCEEKARAAQGPTGEVRVGVNSNTGPTFGASIGVTGDYLAGRDPLRVYEDCVMERTGQGPIRPPMLR